jgi:hypothetical protein
MDKKTIMTGLVVGIFLVSVAHAELCDKADTEESVRYGIQAEEAGRWGVADYNYGGAAICYQINHDWDNTIKYELKSIEMRKKTGVKYGTGYAMVAGYYSKKGPGFEKEIRKYCDLAEEELLKEINADQRYGGSNYISLADCFHLVNDTEKTCMYCDKDNEYSAKKNLGSTNCVVHYGCPKDSTGSSDSSSSGENSGEFPVVPVVGVLFVIVLVVAAFFLLKAKKSKGI